MSTENAYDEVTKKAADSLRKRAAEIRAAAQRCDDPVEYRREMAEARRMKAEADRIDPPKISPKLQKTLKPNVYSNFEDAAAAARAAVAKKRSV